MHMVDAGKGSVLLEDFGWGSSHAWILFIANIANIAKIANIANIEKEDGQFLHPVLIERPMPPYCQSLSLGPGGFSNVGNVGNEL